MTFFYNFYRGLFSGNFFFALKTGLDFEKTVFFSRMKVPQAPSKRACVAGQMSTGFFWGGRFQRFSRTFGL